MELDINLRQAKTLDLDHLPAQTALLLIHPVLPLNVLSFRGFLKRGGTLVILDDFGSAATLLESMQIRRVPLVPGPLIPRLRDDPNLPVAVPASIHPLTSGVSAVVANCAQALEHGGLTPLLTFGSNGQALAYTGAIGRGHLLAVADASIVINDMMAFEGNQRFAKNLLRYMSGTSGQDVILVTEHTQLQSPQSTGQRWISTLSSTLERVSSHPPGARTLVSLAWLLACGVLMLGLFFVVFTKRSRPVSAIINDDPRTALRLRYEALAELDTELKATLAEHCRVTPSSSPTEFAAALRADGESRRFRRHIRILLSALSRIPTATDADDHNRISGKRFNALMQDGSTLLTLLSAPRGDRPRS